MIRRLLVVGTALVVVTGCGAATSDPSSTTKRVPASAVTATTSTTSLTRSVASSTSTTVAPATTVATTTTIAAVEPKFVVFAPGDGYYCNEQPLWFPWGGVSPEADVTIDGVDADVSYQGDTVFGPDMWQVRLPEGIALEEGANDVVFEATFVDGSMLRETRTYHYDPSLQRSTGYLLELTLAVPPRVTIEFATLEYGELGLEQTSDDTEIIETLIADDAVFVVLAGLDIAADQVLDLEAFTQLAAIAARDEPLQDLWWDTIFPTTLRDSWLKAAPWEFLLTPDGRLQQAAQMYSP